MVQFSLRILDKVEPAEYERLAAENARIREEADTIYHGLNERRIHRKFDSFLPQEDEDKKLVAKYENLKASLHPLPDGYFQDISLEWALNGPDSRATTTRPVDHSLAQEFERARDVVRKLMTPYESITPEKSVR